MIPWTRYHSPRLKALWQLAAKVLAMALFRQFGRVELVEERLSSDGFVLEVATPFPIGPEHLESLQQQMRLIVREALPIRVAEMQGSVAAELFVAQDQEMLAESARRVGKQLLALTYIGESVFPGACPQTSTSELGPFALLSCERLALRAQRGRPCAYRISGVAMPTQGMLKSHLKTLVQSRVRNHQALGEESGLFQMDAEGQGACYWLPKGVALLEGLAIWWREGYLKRGFELVRTPCTGSRATLRDGFRDAHGKLFSMNAGATGDLPLKFAELGPLFQESQGSGAGLFQSGCHTGDHAMTLCTESQLLDALISSLQSLINGAKMLDFEICLVVSEGGFGRVIRETLKILALEDRLELSEGGGRGGRIQLIASDRLGREWWGGFVEVSAQPRQMQKGGRPALFRVAQSFFGSLERLSAVLLEHFSGRLPLWLAPEQVRVLPQGMSHRQAAREVQVALVEAGIRAGLDESQGTLGGKVKAALGAYVPYQVVVGDREVESGLVAVRAFNDKSVRQATLESLVEELAEEIRAKWVAS